MKYGILTALLLSGSAMYARHWFQHDYWDWVGIACINGSHDACLNWRTHKHPEFGQ